MLDQHVRIGPLEIRAEAAQDDRMSQVVECVGLAPQAPERSLVVDQIGANELGHRDREEAFVPDQVNL